MFYVLFLCASFRHSMYVDVYHLCMYEIRVNVSKKFYATVRIFLAFSLSVCRFDSNFKDPFQRPSKIPAAGVKHNIKFIKIKIPFCTFTTRKILLTIIFTFQRN